MVPVYIRTQYAGDLFFINTKTMYTIHNIEYQGKYSLDILGDVFAMGVEHLDVMEYDKSAAVVRRTSAEEDFNKNVPNNFRYIDHIRKWEHTKEKIEVILAPDPNALLHGDVAPVDEEAVSNVLVEKYLASLDETERKIYVRRKLGYTQEEIAEEFGFSNNGAVSKRIAGMRKKLDEVQNKKF